MCFLIKNNETLFLVSTVMFYIVLDQSCSKPNENTYRTELDKMAEQLEKYREIICQQEQLLQVIVCFNPPCLYHNFIY